MNKSIVRQNVLPLLAAFIWGTAFVAQSVGSESMNPFAFNAVRSVIAAIFLFFLSIIFDRVNKRAAAGSANGQALGGLDLAGATAQSTANCSEDRVATAVRATEQSAANCSEDRVATAVRATEQSTANGSESSVATMRSAQDAAVGDGSTASRVNGRKASGKDGCESAVAGGSVATRIMRRIGSYIRSHRDLLIGGLLCGVALTVATNLQQSGIGDSGAGKAGFITALYVVLVPVLGVLLKKHVPAQVWVSAAIAVVGLYLLCIKEGFVIVRSDLYLLCCAFVFAVQIMIVDHFIKTVDGVKLSCAQFVVVAILSGICMLIFEEPPTWETIINCAWPLIYTGVFSSGIAYTLQIIAQKDANPTVLSLLLSLESVFATLSGAILLHEKMIGREYIGCILMFSAVILSQLPGRSAKAVESKESVS